MTTLYNFTYTGAEQTVVVPTGVVEARMSCTGAGGSVYNNSGGATITIDIFDLTPGETLYVYVGGQGQNATGVGGWPDGGGCYNGSTGRSGGGSTSIRRGGNTNAHRILVGGAGGGRGPLGTASYSGGAGGYPLGWDGGPSYAGQRGLGGTQVAGGALHYAGSFGQGGESATSSRTGGGGGGGWYGGGAGQSGSSLIAPGGGGSSYYDTTDPNVSLVYAETKGTNGYGLDGVACRGYASIEFADPATLGNADLGGLAVAGGPVAVSRRGRAPRRLYIFTHDITGARTGAIR